MCLWKSVVFIALCKMVYILPTSIADNLGNTSFCEEGWRQYDQLCYKPESSDSDWRTASANCISMGGHLASIHSKKQNDIFEEFSHITGIKYWWTGLHDHEVDGTFVWDDGTDFDFNNWRSSEPYGDYFHSGDCVALSFTNTLPGEWYVLPCSRQVTYLCQKEVASIVATSTEIDDSTETATEMDLITYTSVDSLPTEESSPCEEGWEYFDQHCFKYQGEDDWRRASATCISMGGNLPSIHSKEQNDVLGHFVDVAGITHFWIGLHDHEIDGTFVWDDGTDFDFTNWRSSEPYGDYVHSGDCAAVSFSGHLIGEWYILPCSRNIHFICQKKVTTNVTTSTEMHDPTVTETTLFIRETYETRETTLFITETYETTQNTHLTTEKDYETETIVLTSTKMDDTTAYMFPHTIDDNFTQAGLPSCEEGWKPFAQHCFKLEKEHLDWNNASEKCNIMGGNLASIHSKEQNDFFEVFTKDAEKTYWWIGLYKKIFNGFAWEDGTDVDYTNWKPREPQSTFHYSAYSVAQSFSVLNFGNWYTLDRRRKLPYLCQKNMSTSVIPNEKKTGSPVYIVPTTSVSNVPRKDLSPCEDGWKLYEQNCFKLEESELEWRAASAKCKTMGGHLSSIHSQEQNDFFEEITKETGQMIWWTGLRNPEADGTYEWDDGTDVNYTNWRPSEPVGSYFSYGGNCVAQSFTISSNTHGMWYVLECSRRLYSMCQRKITGSGSTSTDSDVSTATSPLITSTELDIRTVTRSEITSTELDISTVTRSEITSTELDISTVTRSEITSTELDISTVLTNRKLIKEIDEKEGFISVTTHAVTITIVVMFMALLAALLYWKRPWIEERRSKVATVFFKRNDRIAEPSTEFIIQPEETR